LAIQLSDEMIVMTKENTIQDQPCNLIEKGVFDTLFEDEHIVFDKIHGKFIVR
jgi:iron complex transport system ATP-binding protein